MQTLIKDGKIFANINQLTNWESNPRSIKDKDFERLKTQIRDLGQHTPLLVDKRGVVYGGNMRLRAFRELGINDIWVSVIDAETEEDKMRYALSSNDRAGFYDEDLLANMAGNYPDFNWEDYAVDLLPPKSLQDLIDSLKPIEEDEIPEVADGEPESKLGEVYQLGRHRLLVGDATKIEDVEKLMDGQKADMVFTDPPYGINLDTDYSKMPGTHTKYKEVIGDSEPFDMTKVFEIVDSPIWYVWGADYLYKTIKDFDKGNMIVWAKRQSEAENEVFGSAYELCWTFPRRKKEIWFIRGINQSAERLGEHPTQKPIALGVRALKDNPSTNIVLDLFGGTGSTLIAAEQTNRNCYMMELDPKYCDVIRKRYANFIGKSEEWEKETPMIPSEQVKTENG